jgi:hypothetical protein
MAKKDTQKEPAKERVLSTLPLDTPDTQGPTLRCKMCSRDIHYITEDLFGKLFSHTTTTGVECDASGTFVRIRIPTP